MARGNFQLQSPTQQRNERAVLGRITNTELQLSPLNESTTPLETTETLSLYEGLGVNNFERVDELKGINANDSIGNDFLTGSMIQAGARDMINSMYDYAMTGAQSLLPGDPYVPMAHQPHVDGWYVDYEQTTDTGNGTVSVEVSSASDSNGNSYKGYDTIIENDNGTSHFQTTEEVYDSEGNLISSSTTNEYFYDTKDSNGKTKREKISKDEYDAINDGNGTCENSGGSTGESNDGGWFSWLSSLWGGSKKKDKEDEDKGESGDDCFDKPWLRDHFLQPVSREINGLQIDSMYEMQGLNMEQVYIPVNDFF